MKRNASLEQLMVSSGLYQFRELINKNIQVNGVDVTNDITGLESVKATKLLYALLKKQRSGKAQVRVRTVNRMQRQYRDYL